MATQEPICSSKFTLQNGKDVMGGIRKMSNNKRVYIGYVGVVHGHLLSVYSYQYDFFDPALLFY